MFAHRLAVGSAPGLGLALVLAAVGCAAGAPPKAPADATLTRADSAPPVAASPIKPDLIVYTYSDFQIHGSQTKGRWFRRTSGGGWESADCNQSTNPDARNNAGPDCGPWSAVSADKVPLVESARATGYDTTTCPKQRALCDAFGLKEETR